MLYLKQHEIFFDNDQLDAHLLYFTVRLRIYMLIIRRLNLIDAASGIVTLSQWPSGAPDLLRVTIPDAASIKFNLLMISI